MKRSFKPKDVGPRLAEWRRERGWKAELIADALDVQVGTLRRIERGEIGLTLEQAGVLAFMGNFSIEDLGEPVD